MTARSPVYPPGEPRNNGPFFPHFPAAHGHRIDQVKNRLKRYPLFLHQFHPTVLADQNYGEPARQSAVAATQVFDVLRRYRMIRPAGGAGFQKPEGHEITILNVIPSRGQAFFKGSQPRVGSMGRHEKQKAVLPA